MTRGQLRSQTMTRKASEALIAAVNRIPDGTAVSTIELAFVAEVAHQTLKRLLPVLDELRNAVRSGKIAISARGPTPAWVTQIGHPVSRIDLSQCGSFLASEVLLAAGFNSLPDDVFRADGEFQVRKSAQLSIAPRSARGKFKTLVSNAKVTQNTVATEQGMFADLGEAKALINQQAETARINQETVSALVRLQDHRGRSGTAD